MNNTANELGTKILLIAVIEKDDAILMRKKPEGSLPYKETWYLFGCERVLNQDDSKTISEYIKKTLNIDIYSIIQIGEDSEVKQDHDGIVKKFIYIDFSCFYKNGLPKTPEGAEKVEWIPKEKIKEYDIVPPSKKLLKKIGYLN
ncbi:MAG: hypothetical protein PHE59_01255 [Patescibacteria group bacterium]|nr:hypothetical protein [Patescibacteria group bacterium]MDD5535020.1 hypothetical protein [Patescibacteria group bacterium]